MTPLVVVHIAAASMALGCGVLALRFPNGTTLHRRIGLAYLAAWAVLAPTGFAIGAKHPGISAFEALTVFSLACVVIAYSYVLRRRTVGKIWVNKHYRWMLNSIAGLVVATINQVLPRVGVHYPRWVFYAIAIAPVFVIPLYRRRLDRRYGFAPAAS